MLHFSEQLCFARTTTHYPEHLIKLTVNFRLFEQKAFQLFGITRPKIREMEDEKKNGKIKMVRDE